MPAGLLLPAARLLPRPLGTAQRETGCFAETERQESRGEKGAHPGGTLQQLPWVVPTGKHRSRPVPSRPAAPGGGTVPPRKPPTPTPRNQRSPPLLFFFFF